MRIYLCISVCICVYMCLCICVCVCACLSVYLIFSWRWECGSRKSEVGNRVSWCLHITIIRLVPLSDLFDMCPGPLFSLAWNCAYLDLAWTCSKPCIRRQSTIDKRDKREEATISSLRATARVQLRQSGIGYTYIYIYIYLCMCNDKGSMDSWVQHIGFWLVIHAYYMCHYSCVCVCA